jgi:hypothetical protein
MNHVCLPEQAEMEDKLFFKADLSEDPVIPFMKADNLHPLINLMFRICCPSFFDKDRDPVSGLDKMNRNFPGMTFNPADMGVIVWNYKDNIHGRIGYRATTTRLTALDCSMASSFFSLFFQIASRLFLAKTSMEAVTV